MQECTESEQGDRISRTSSGLRHAGVKCSLFGRVEFRHQAMDSLKLVLCRSGEREVADAFIPMLLTLGDGSVLCSQLPSDKLFECRHACLLFRPLARQASEIPNVFGHLLDNGPVGCEVRLVAGNEIAPMATFRGAKGFSD